MDAPYFYYFFRFKHLKFQFSPSSGEDECTIFEIPYPFRASVIWDLATHITIKTHTQKHGCQYFQNLEKLKCNFCLQLNIKKLLWQLFPKGLQACEKSFKIHFCLQILRIYFYNSNITQLLNFQTKCKPSTN